MEAIEQEFHAAFPHGEGMVTSGLLAVAHLSKDVEQRSEETRRGFDYPLARNALIASVMKTFVGWASRPVFGMRIRAR
jgi:hypothetical protein